MISFDEYSMIVCTKTLYTYMWCVVAVYESTFVRKYFRTKVLSYTATTHHMYVYNVLVHTIIEYSSNDIIDFITGLRPLSPELA